MANITSIKDPNSGESLTLPDGSYSGLWGGHEINLNYKGKVYRLETEDGVRGFNIPVSVSVDNGVATFSGGGAY